MAVGNQPETAALAGLSVAPMTGHAQRKAIGEAVKRSCSGTSGRIFPTPDELQGRVHLKRRGAKHPRIDLLACHITHDPSGTTDRPRTHQRGRRNPRCTQDNRHKEAKE